MSISEWWTEQKRKARRIFRMWVFAVLLLGFTVGYTHLILYFGRVDPESILSLIAVLPLAVMSTLGVFWLLFVRGRP